MNFAMNLSFKYTFLEHKFNKSVQYALFYIGIRALGIEYTYTQQQKQVDF